MKTAFVRGGRMPATGDTVLIKFGGVRDVGKVKDVQPYRIVTFRGWKRPGIMILECNNTKKSWITRKVEEVYFE